MDIPAGGPGPEIPIAIDQFSLGEQVRLTVTVTTEGGQTEEDTLTVTVQGQSKNKYQHEV